MPMTRPHGAETVVYAVAGDAALVGASGGDAFPRLTASACGVHTYQYQNADVAHAVMRLSDSMCCDKDVAGRGGW